MASELTLATLALPNRRWDVTGNLERLAHWVGEAVRQGAQFVIAPEAYLDGYCLEDLQPPLSAESVQRYREVAHEWPDGPAPRRLAELAKGLGIHLICGGIEQEGERLYNTAFYFAPEGPIGRYHKTHIGWERLLHTPGESLPVFESPWGKFGILICYDRQFPEAARALALAGALLIVVPSNGMYRGINDHIMMTRAYENSAYLAFAHPLDGLIISPRGRVIAANEEEGREEVVVRRIDLARAQEARQRPESLLSERQPHLYGCLSR